MACWSMGHGCWARVDEGCPEEGLGTILPWALRLAPEGLGLGCLPGL